MLIPQALKSAFISEKDTTRGKWSAVGAKGKGRELRMEVSNEDVGTSSRVWLGVDTPYKGPNKWFGGGRLQNQESLASQTTSGARKTDQNILFGIAPLNFPPGPRILPRILSRLDPCNIDSRNNGQIGTHLRICRVHRRLGEL